MNGTIWAIGDSHSHDYYTSTRSVVEYGWMQLATCNPLNFAPQCKHSVRYMDGEEMQIGLIHSLTIIRILIYVYFHVCCKLYTVCSLFSVFFFQFFFRWFSECVQCLVPFGVLFSFFFYLYLVVKYRIISFIIVIVYRVYCMGLVSYTLSSLPLHLPPKHTFNPIKYYETDYIYNVHWLAEFLRHNSHTHIRIHIHTSVCHSICTYARALVSNVNCKHVIIRYQKLFVSLVFCPFGCCCRRCSTLFVIK